MSKQEIIKSEISCSAALDQLSTQAIIDYLFKDKDVSVLLECIDSDGLIKHLGGIDQILEDHPEAVQDHVTNIHASHEEDGL